MSLSYHLTQNFLHDQLSGLDSLPKNMWAEIRRYPQLYIMIKVAMFALLGQKLIASTSKSKQRTEN